MPRTLSAEQVEEFRARLCEVAQHRFATQGRDAVTMRQLADALGCSPMTPYRYFRNKDEILAAVRAAAFDRFAEALEEAAARARGDLRAAGQAVGQAYVRFALGDPDAYRLMFDVAQPHPDRYPELVRASTRARRTMSASTEALVEAGVFHGDPELLGLAFWSAMHGLVMLHLAGKLPGERDFETIRGELMRLLVTGARAG
jgi:AcrR family transcriptional regulator